MIVPDANLLHYAYDSKSPFHDRAAHWWSGCLSGRESVGLCGVVLFSFLRIGTNRRAFIHPMAIDEAAGHVRSWLQRSVTELLVLEETDLLVAMEWLEAQGSGGNLTTDAQIAAIAARYRATVNTADTDFQRFRGVRWVNPLVPG